MTSSNAKAWNKKYVLVNNLGSKHSLVIKFDQFRLLLVKSSVIVRFYVII